MAVTLADNALTSVVNAKAYLGGVCASNDLGRLINQASTLIESQAFRSFGIQSVTEEVPGYGTLRLLVERTPLKSISEIRYDGDAIDLTEVEIENAGAGSIIRPGGWRWTAHVKDDISRGPIPGSELNLWEVDYVGGYVLPKDDGDPAAPISGASTDLPSDLELACLELIRQIQTVQSRDPTVRSEKLMSWSATYDNSLRNTMVDTIVAKYRRCSP